MATSGSINYTVTTSDIITEALELLGVLGEGESYTSNQYTSSLRTLNMLTKTWQANGLNLFAVQKNILFLQKDQSDYTLSSSTSDHYTSSFVQTTTSAASTSGLLHIDVTSTSGIAATNYIGIQTSGTEMFWTTVTSVVGSTVNLSGALPSDISSGALVYVYQSKANRPMRVLEAYIRRNTTTSSPVDIPVGMLSRIDYWQLSTKQADGQVVQMYFDPQRATSTLSVWPQTSSELDYAILFCQRTLSDFDSASDEPDYPQEWFLPLAYNLAVVLAPKYGTPAMDFQRIQQMASALYVNAEGWDEEQETSVYFKPDNWGYDYGRKGN